MRPDSPPNSLSINRSRYVRPLQPALPIGILVIAIFGLHLTADSSSAEIVLTPAPAIADSHIESEYLQYLQILRQADPGSTIDLSDFIQLDEKMLAERSLAELYVQDDFAERIVFDFSVRQGPTDGTTELSTNAEWKSQEVQFDLEYPLAELLDQIELSLLDSDGAYDVAAATSFLVHVTLHKTSFQYSSLAIWLRSEANQGIYLKIMDPALRSGAALKTRWSAAQDALARAVETSTSNDTDPDNSIGETSALRCRPLSYIKPYSYFPDDNAMVFITNATVWDPRDNNPAPSWLGLPWFDIETAGHPSPSHPAGYVPNLHEMGSKPELHCDCWENCTNSAFIRLTGSKTFENTYDQSDSHMISNFAFDTEDTSVRSTDGQAVFGHAALGAAFTNCLSPQPFCAMLNDATGSISFNTPLPKDSSLSGSEFSVQLSDPEASKPLSIWISGQCKPCQGLRAATGNILGLERGAEVKIQVEFEENGELNRITHDEVYEQFGANGEPIRFITDKVIPEPLMGDSRRVKVSAVPADGGICDTGCQPGFGYVEADDVEADIVCTGSHTGENSTGTPSEDNDTCSPPQDGYEISAIFDDVFPGVEGHGGTNVELLLYSPGATSPYATETRVVRSTSPPLEPVVYSNRARHGDRALIRIRQSGIGLTCTVIPGDIPEVRSPIQAIVTCDVGATYWCHYTPAFCESDDCDSGWDWQPPTLIESDRPSLDVNGDKVVELGFVYQDCGSFASATSNYGPITYARTSSTDTWSGNIPIRGVARDDNDGVTRVRVFVDGQAVNLTGFSIDLADARTCSEFPADNCDANSSFEGLLDSTQFSDGTHTLMIVADRGPGTTPGFDETTITFDNSGGGGGGTTGPDAATVLAHTLPTQMTCGATQPVSVTLRNSGTNTWTTEACYKLGSYGDSDPFIDGNRRWALPGSVPVEPDDDVTFHFDLTAPSQPGSYTTDWQMISQVNCGGNGWFGPVVAQSVDVTCEPQDDAQIVSHTLPFSMSCGTTKTVQVTVRNTGTSVWTAAQGYELGMVGGSDPLYAGGSLELPANVTVNPGEDLTFQFTLEAGTALEGTLLTDWRMKRGGQFFGATASRQVNVSCIDNAEVVNHTIPSEMICGSTHSVQITMRNTGESTWPATEFALATTPADPFRPGDPKSFGVPYGVAPGALATFNIPLVAPDLPGQYATSWRMRSPSSSFGQSLIKTVELDCGGVLAVTAPDGSPMTSGDLLDFGSVPAGQTAERVVTLCNTGTGILEITPKGGPIFVAGGGFSSYQDPQQWVEPGICTQLGIRFQSSTAGSATGMAQFYGSDHPEDPVTIHLAAEVAQGASP